MTIVRLPEVTGADLDVGVGAGLSEDRESVTRAAGKPALPFGVEPTDAVARAPVAPPRASPL